MNQTHVHIYPSSLKFENRIEREVYAISELDVLIVVLGTHEKGLAKNERWSERILIKRLNKRFDANLLSRILFIFIFQALCICEIARIRPSIVNLHSLSTLPLAPFCRLLGARIIYDAHELETETKQLKGVRKKVSKLIEGLFIKMCFAHIFVSKSIEKHYKESYGITNTAVVRNLPLYRAATPKNIFRNTFNITDDTKIFLYQGALVDGRGLNEIIEAFKGSHEHALVIMGFGGLTEKIKETANYYSNVYYHPAVSSDELLDYTASADFGILSTDDSCLNHIYCLPNKLFEYIMAGLPILSSELTEVKIILEEYKCGLTVKSFTKPSIQNAASKIINRNYDRDCIFETARHLNWETDKILLQEFYKTRILC